MTRPILRLVVAATALAIAGCFIATNHQAGHPCDSRDDCSRANGEGDDFYDCVADGTDAGTRMCQIIYPPVPVPQDGGTTGDGGTAEPAFWCGQVQPLMQTYCSSCHGEDRSGSGNNPIRLDSYDDVTLPDGGVLKGAKASANRIKVRTVDLKNMPPPDPSLPQPTETERQVINRWVQTGAPQCDGGM